ncbi:MAG: HDOD domain-containing protein [Pontiellaceae bacterium]|nr:HDOD domain-containing protein [Pontiellaceae bacterium]
MKRILLIKPSRNMFDALKMGFRSVDSSCDVLYAATAEEALSINAEHRCDLVATSNELDGEMSGLELLAELKATSPETIRFFIIDESEEKSMRGGLVDVPQQVLTYPVNLKNFVQQAERAFALRSVIRNPQILKLLGRADSLPPLPRVFHRISEKMNDPNASLYDIAAIVEEDIVLSSKVLKLANSSLFNLRMPVGTVSQAVSFLGSRTVGSLVFSQGLGETFSGGHEMNYFLEELNRHSLECATMLTHILTSWNSDQKLIDKAFFCGIAHDLGKLVLAKYAPQEWLQIMQAIEAGDRTDVEIEREVVGITHAEIAAYLLAVWGFPNDQVIAVAFHHNPAKIRSRDPGILCALHLAENLLSTHLHGSDLDWNYLEDCRISHEDVDMLSAMVMAAAMGEAV